MNVQSLLLKAPTSPSITGFRHVFPALIGRSLTLFPRPRKSGELSLGMHKGVHLNHLDLWFRPAAERADQD